MIKTAMGAGALLVVAGSATAAIYHDEGLFKAALAGSFGVETFDERPVIEQASYDFGAFSMRETGGYNNVVVSGDAHNRFGVVSEENVASYQDDGDSVLTFDTFDRAYTAFGFYISAKWNTVFEIVAASQSVRFEFAKGSDPVFIGFTGDELESVVVASAGTPRVAFDDVTYGFSAPVEVPVPAGAGLLGLGLFGLAALGRRRRHC